MNPMPNDLMKRSPLDAPKQHCQAPALTTISTVPMQEWMPSRYNARTTDESGNTILWNSARGSMSVFNTRHAVELRRYLSQTGTSGQLTKLGSYLNERGFIVPKGTHEYRQFVARFGEQHYRTDTLELILLSSEDCNLRCKYCYEDFKRGTMLPSVRRNIKELLKKRAPAIRNFGIHWFGGEPLYGMEAIEDLAPFFLEMVESHGWNYSVTMTTNGYLLTPEVATRLLAWRVRKFQITLDGPAEQHDVNRPGRDGGKSFDTIFANLQALQQQDCDFYVKLRVNYDRTNKSAIEPLLSMLQQTFSGDKRFGVAFNAVGKWGGENDDCLEVCAPSESRAAKFDMQKSALDKNLSVGTLADSHSFGTGACYAARPYNFIIGADGAVMKCTVSLDKDDHNIVGALLEGGELVLDGEKLSRWVEPSFGEDKLCQKCHLLPSCQGLSCPLIRIESNRSPCEATNKTYLSNELKLALLAKTQSARLVQLNI